MKYFLYILLFISSSMSSQELIEAAFIKTIDIDTQSIIGIDNFGIIYAVKGNALSKTEENKILTYSNVQLGNISSANAFNTLKINLFYKNFNTAIILDNRLAEIYKIDFNTVQPYKNVSHISTGYDTTLWAFNTDLQQLELYDYKNNTIRANTLPVESNVLDMRSNYNYCWLLTEKHLYTFNYFGSLVSKLNNDGFTALTENNGNVILKNNNKLFFLAKNSQKLIPIKIKELLINQFLLTNETLYIYDSVKLHQYQLKIN